MIPEEWLRVRGILEPALELDAGERSRFLDAACAETALRRDVESLIELHEQAGTSFLNSPPVADFCAAEEMRSGLSNGTRVGAYEIVEEIARGGMATVYRAVRADGEYSQEVALKIVRTGTHGELIAARFRHERQILAELDHPNICKLLDGGATGDGLPYFAMELIDGQSITEYCDQHRLSIDERLRLFHTVCTAVHYAHQHLLIHRDIKPGNILVTREGVPKLLDFGIAKALKPTLAPEKFSATVSGLWMMTPNYASPEQIRGEAVTTSTDVYSLGLVLYELLTGRRANATANPNPHEIAELTCNVEPEKPSTAIWKTDEPWQDSARELRRSRKGEARARDRATTSKKLQKRLSGDLDNIVLMALRKEAGRRYTSAEKFAEDVRRHLENLPVSAQADSARYRAAKFVSRHPAGVAASIVVAIVMLGGFAVTVYEAHVARQQAEIAREQRARADRRFNDVRALANSLMFEIHDSIKDLPGATPARKLLVERALQYLDGLSKETNSDEALQRELASAYDRIGDITGNTSSANLGDFSGALQSYNKALAIREAAAQAQPDDAQIQGDLLNDYFRMSFVMQDAGDFAGAQKYMAKALPVAQKLAAENSDPKYKDWLAGIYWKRARVFVDSGDDAQALENFRQSLAIRQTIAANSGANPIFRTHLAGDYLGLGEALSNTGNGADGLKNAQTAVEILEQLAAASPTNSTLKEYLAEAYCTTSRLYEKQHAVAQALSASEKAEQIFGELLAADSKDSLARSNLALMELFTGRLLFEQGRTAESLPHLRSAVSRFEAIPQKNRYDLAGEAKARALLDKVSAAKTNGNVAKVAQAQK